MNRLAQILRSAADSVAAVFFPAPCRICGAPLPGASRIPICADCLSQFQQVPAPACEKCGRPFASLYAGISKNPLCHLCRRGVYDFDLARSFAAYDDAMVRAITLLKYNAIAPLGDWFAARLAELLARQSEAPRPNAVVPVPLHAARLRERGFNQAELIARPLARHLGLPLKPSLLVRTRPRPNRLKLSRKERWRTVRGAYAIRKGAEVDNLSLLLVDDVFTTGATLDACSRALRRAGAAVVVGVTVARVLPPGFLRQGPPCDSTAASSI